MNNERLYREFQEATRQICDDLEINPRKVKLERYETQRLGLDYSAGGKSKSARFDFHLRTRAKGLDVTDGKMEANLAIYYSDSAVPFHFHEDIDYLKTHPNFLGR